MSDNATENLTLLLNAMQSGDREAAERVAGRMHETLGAVADALMRGERAGHTLTGEDLFQMAWMKLMGQQEVTWESRAHFRGAFACEMRRILIDHARRRRREKHGGTFRRVALDDLAEATESRGIDLVEMGDLLEQLGAQSPRHVQVVEMKFFLDMTSSEIAHILGVSTRTVEGDWSFAKAWLQSHAASDGDKSMPPLNDSGAVAP